MRFSLKILINDRDSAFKNKQKSKYLRLCNEVRQHIKYLKSKYLENAVKSNNSKKLWDVINVLGHPQESIPHECF